MFESEYAKVLRNLRLPNAISGRDLFSPTIRRSELQRFLRFVLCLWFLLGRNGHANP